MSDLNVIAALVLLADDLVIVCPHDQDLAETISDIVPVLVECTENIDVDGVKSYEQDDKSDCLSRILPRVLFVS
jgi:hypothetical protein